REVRRRLRGGSGIGGPLKIRLARNQGDWRWSWFDSRSITSDRLGLRVVRKQARCTAEHAERAENDHRLSRDARSERGPTGIGDACVRGVVLPDWTSVHLPTM